MNKLIDSNAQISLEQKSLTIVIEWIEGHTSGLTFRSDERTLLALGCFDVALEHQAAIGRLTQLKMYGSAFALLRVLTESLVRGLWLLSCANDNEIEKFKRGKFNKSFAKLIEEYEAEIGTPMGVLSNFKATAWEALNGFTHTGFHQVSRRHKFGRVEGNYAAEEILKALRVTGALGLIAAGQLIAMSGKYELISLYNEKLSEFASNP